jgi:hypothetical protein
MVLWNINVKGQNIDRSLIFLLKGLSLYLLLPLINAVFDWVSWGITRALFKASSRLSGLKGVILQALTIILDLATALLFLYLLALAIPFLLESINWGVKLAGSNVYFPWENYLHAVKNAPFSDGLLVTSMLLTTLIPSVLHVAFGIFGIVQAISPASRKAARLIPTDKAEVMSAAKVTQVVHVLIWSNIWRVVSVLVVSAGLWGLWLLVGSYFSPFLTYLLDTALCSSSMFEHGRCSMMLVE